HQRGRLGNSSEALWVLGKVRRHLCPGPNATFCRFTLPESARDRRRHVIRKIDGEQERSIDFTLRVLWIRRLARLAEPIPSRTQLPDLTFARGIDSSSGRVRTIWHKDERSRCSCLVERDDQSAPAGPELRLRLIDLWHIHR